MFFFFKQKTAYEMRISDWSSDVCSSDLIDPVIIAFDRQRKAIRRREAQRRVDRIGVEAIGVLVEQRVGQETILLTVRGGNPEPQHIARDRPADRKSTRLNSSH